MLVGIESVDGLEGERQQHQPNEPEPQQNHADDEKRTATARWPEMRLLRGIGVGRLWRVPLASGMTRSAVRDHFSIPNAECKISRAA